MLLYSTRTKAWVTLQFGEFIVDETKEVQEAVCQCYLGREVFKGEHEGSVFDRAAEKCASQICKVHETQASKRSLKIVQMNKNQQNEI